MPTKQIHVVMALNDHEPSYAIRAFMDAAAAHDFIESLLVHDRKRPHCPERIEDTLKNDVAFERWHRAYTKWIKHHPAGREHALCDDYGVATIGLSYSGEELPPSLTQVAYMTPRGAVYGGVSSRGNVPLYRID